MRNLYIGLSGSLMVGGMILSLLSMTVFFILEKKKVPMIIEMIIHALIVIGFVTSVAAGIYFFNALREFITLKFIN